MAQSTITVNDRDLKVIQLITHLNDKEIFGLTCFLAGTRVREQDIGCRDREKDALNN